MRQPQMESNPIYSLRQIWTSRQLLLSGSIDTYHHNHNLFFQRMKLSCLYIQKREDLMDSSTLFQDSYFPMLFSGEYLRENILRTYFHLLFDFDRSRDQPKPLFCFSY